MVHGAAVDFFEMLGIIFVVTLIGAVILQISCALYNMMAGSPGKPSADSAPVGEPTTESKSEPDPAPTPSGDQTEDQSSAITTTPLRKQALAAEDAWPDYKSMAALPGVPKLRFERAMAIIFIAALGNALANYILRRVLRLTGQVAGPDIVKYVPILLVSFPLGILILSGTISVMLPTRFGKALLVTLIYLFFGVLIATVFVLIALIFGLRFTWFGEALGEWLA